MQSDGPADWLGFVRERNGDAPTCSDIGILQLLQRWFCQLDASEAPQHLNANRPFLWLSFGLPAHPARRRFLRPQPLELSRIELAVAHCVLQPLVAQESGACLEVGASDEIEATGMAQHVRVDFQGGEFRWQFQPVEHTPECGWLDPKHPIRRPQPWRTQWPQEALVLLRKGMLAGL